MNNGFLSLTLSGLFTFGTAFAVPLPQDQAQPQHQRPQHGGRRMDPDKQLAMFTRRLNLSADQQSQLRPILADRQQQVQAVWANESLSPQDKMAKIKTIREDSRAKIEAVLNADQKQKFDQMQQQSREQRERNGNSNQN